MSNYFLALGLTQVIEIPIAYFIGLRKRYELVALFFINCFTNQLINLIVNILSGTINLFILIFFAELLVFVVESFLLYWVLDKNIKKSLFISLVINLTSFSVGIVLRIYQII